MHRKQKNLMSKSRVEKLLKLPRRPNANRKGSVWADISEPEQLAEQTEGLDIAFNIKQQKNPFQFIMTFYHKKL